jgi:hypothetical protein
MPRKRKSRTRSEAMASMELMRERSRFCRDFQYRVTLKCAVLMKKIFYKKRASMRNSQKDFFIMNNVKNLKRIIFLLG